MRALAELYPGGLTRAKTVAERARLLDDIDRAYFGAQGSTSEQSRASRAQLAQSMLREDPVAFREMVFEGIRALEAADASSVRPHSIAEALGRGSASVTQPLLAMHSANAQSPQAAAHQRGTASAGEAQ